MRSPSDIEVESDTREPSFHAELLLLPDGRVLVHNLTPTLARLLAELGASDGRTLQPDRQPAPGTAPVANRDCFT